MALKGLQPQILISHQVRTKRRYHAGVHGGLLYVSGDPGDKRISVLKVGVEVGLLEDKTIIINYECVQAMQVFAHI